MPRSMPSRKVLVRRLWRLMVAVVGLGVPQLLLPAHGVASSLEFPPVADAYVYAKKKSRNYGAAHELIVDGSERVSFLRFVVAGVSGGPIGDARLRLEVSRPSKVGGAVHLISPGTWDESTLTYRKRPPIDGPALQTLGRVAAGDIVEFDLTGAITGDGSYDLAIDSPSSDGTGFWSSEATGVQRPLLILTMGVGTDAANTPPTVTITAPSEGDTLTNAPAVVLAGAAHDVEDGSLGAGLTWVSDVDGELAIGASAAAVLSPGAHRITAGVTDSGGLAATAAVNVFVDAVSSFEIELTPTADAYVREDKPSANYGASTVMWVDGDPDSAAYIRFDTRGVGAGRVTRALLRLRVADESGAASESGGTIHALPSASWSEGSVTYYTRPPVGVPGFATIGAVERGRTVEIDVTPAMTGDGTIDFALVTPLGDAVKYQSRESASPPRLALTVEGPVQVGRRDFAFGAGVDGIANRATASKPESKLWHHDGLWWAVLFNPTAGGGHRIHVLDPVTDQWLDTGALVDERPDSRGDVLSDGDTLYVTSRAQAQNRLARFTYDPTVPTYTLDAGFPIAIDGAGTESLNIAKDSAGTLWIAYTLGGTVLVNCTVGDDTHWGTPFVVPVALGTSVAPDDIAGVRAFDGKVGVFWSDQLSGRFYFAVHDDGDAVTDPSAWTLEVAAEGNRIADDHFNLKVATDGRVFASVKTSLTHGSQTLVGLLVRSTSGVWSPLHRVTTEAFQPNRPACLLDEAAGLVYVFYALDNSGIYYKTSAIDDIAFPAGVGAPFIDTSAVLDVQGPTTTSQSVNAATGIVVVGSSPADQSYWHNTTGMP